MFEYFLKGKEGLEFPFTSTFINVLDAATNGMRDVLKLNDPEKAFEVTQV
jgi:hypothetical protein